MPIESVMPSNHLILCRPLLLLPSIFPSIRVFSNEPALHIRWPKYWSFSFNISPSNEYSGLIPLRWTGWIFLQSEGLSRVFSNTTVQKHWESHFLGRLIGSLGVPRERGVWNSQGGRKDKLFCLFLHSLGLYNNNVSCLRTVFGLNLLANSVILKCKLWE